MAENQHGSEKSHGEKRSQPTHPMQESIAQHGIDFSYLPDVVLLQVFGYLDTQDKVSIAKVCTRWRNVVYCPTLWKGVVVLLRPNSITSSVVASLKARGICAVIMAESCKPQKMFQLVKKAALESLLWPVPLTRNQLIEAFLGDLPDMKHLFIHMDKANAAVAQYLGDCMCNLQHLQLWGCMQWDIFTGLHVLKNVKQLELGHAGKTPLQLQEDPFELKEMPCLTDLRVMNIEVSNKFLLELKHACPNLQSLIMNKCVSFFDESLNQLARITNLQKLTIWFQHGQNCPAILPENFANLKVLAILNSSIWDDDMKNLANLPALESLFIDVKNMTTVGWKHLSKGFKKLKLVEIFMCQSLTQWKAWCLGQLPNLQEFRLECDKQRHPRDLQPLGQALSHLKRLQLRGDHTWPKDHDMRAVAAMEGLEGLALTRCPKVSDEGMKFLAKGCAPLQCLSLHNTMVKKEGLYHFASHKTLTRLSIKGPNVNVARLLMQKLPDLQVLTADVDGSTKKRLKLQKPGLVLKDLSRCCVRDEFGL